MSVVVYLLGTAETMTTQQAAQKQRQTAPVTPAASTCVHLVVRDGRCTLCDVKVARYTL